MERKCIVLNQDNVNYVKKFIDNKSIKNFSNAINKVIENSISNEKFEKSNNICHLQNEEFSVKIVKKEEN